MGIKITRLTSLLAGFFLGGCCDGDFITPVTIPITDYDLYAYATDVTTFINGTSQDAAFTTVGASPDLTTGSCWDNTTPIANRWFRFTGPASGEISITVDIGGSKGTQQRTEMALWESNGTTQRACSKYVGDGDDVVITNAGLVAGTTYYVSVDVPADSYRGSFTLVLSDSFGPTAYSVFVSNASSGDVSVIDPVGQTELTTLECFATGCSEPRNLAVSPNGLMVYVPFRFANKVAVIDPETQTTVADISDASFDEPYAVTFTADNTEAWVVNKQGGGSTTGSITVINIATRTVTTVVNHVSIASPEGIAMANGKAYVANRGNGTVSVFNVSTRAFITSIATGGSPRFAVATPNQAFVYVSDAGGIRKISTADESIVGTIAMTGRNLAVSIDGTKVFVGSQTNNIGIIDVATGSTSSIVTPSGSIYGVAISTSLNLGFATDENNNLVYLFNPVTNALLLDGFGAPITITVGSTPRAIAAQ